MPISHTTLRLNPWKDGFKQTLNLLEQNENANKAKTVYVVFNENDFIEYLHEEDAIVLFETIGSKLLRLESVIIQVNISSKLPSITIPPIQALTSLLRTENSKINYLTMLGLRMEGNDLDMNGMIEALRIHPYLHSVVVKNCSFLCTYHLDQLRATLTRRRGMKHCDLLDNFVTVTERGIRWKPIGKYFFCLLLLGFVCCIIPTLDFSKDGIILERFRNIPPDIYDAFDRFKAVTGGMMKRDKADQNKRTGGKKRRKAGNK